MRKNGKRELGMETLERRELMAGDIRFDARSGALSITGTAAADTVQIHVLTPTQMDVRINGSYQRVNPARVRSITIDLGAGNDSVEMNGHDQTKLNPDLIDIKLGTGGRERISLRLPSVDRLNIDARASRETGVIVNTSVTDRFFVDMGIDGAADTVTLLTSDINRLDANMGGGNDSLLILGTSIQKANVKMGDGNDKVITQQADAGAYAASGTLDGGSGAKDIIDPVFRNRARHFERVWSW